MEEIMLVVNKAMPYAALPLSLAALALVLWHAASLMGWKPAAKMVGLGWIIAYALEEFGVHTGIIYGRYYFTYLMGPKLDVIPLALPCLWVVLIYIAFLMTNLLMDGSPLPQSHSWGHILFTALLAGLLVTTFDLNADPFAVDNGWWVWIDKGPYYGVPVHNYVGWFIVAFVSYVAHGIQMKRLPEQPDLSQKSKAVRILSIAPLAVYGLAMLIFIVINFDHKLGLVTVYAYGIPFLACLWRWVQWYKETKTVVKDTEVEEVTAE